MGLSRNRRVESGNSVGENVGVGAANEDPEPFRMHGADSTSRRFSVRRHIGGKDASVGEAEPGGNLLNRLSSDAASVTLGGKSKKSRDWQFGRDDILQGKETTSYEMPGTPLGFETGYVGDVFRRGQSKRGVVSASEVDLTLDNHNIRSVGAGAVVNSMSTDEDDFVEGQHSSTLYVVPDTRGIKGVMEDQFHGFDAVTRSLRHQPKAPTRASVLACIHFGHAQSIACGARKYVAGRARVCLSMRCSVKLCNV